MASSSSIYSKRRTCSSLSDDILIEIFTYLPLNSIYKFRCLSKVWLSNLSNPNFFTKWFQINHKSLPWINYHTMYHNDGSGANPLRFINAYPESHSELISRNEHLFSFEFLMNQKPFQGARLYLSGSSNGLVLFDELDFQRRYHVCNPLTQTWVSLPSPLHSLPYLVYQYAVNGIFCEYSSSLACCYKVVHIPQFDEPSKTIVVDIFSSDLGVWQSFEVSCDENVVGRRWDKRNNVVILDDVLYWIEGQDRMLVYNLNQKNGSDRHRCSLTHLPVEEFSPGHYYNSILGESEGLVCCARTRCTGKERALSVWVLDEVNWKILHKDISIEDIILAEKRSRTGDPVKMLEVLGFSPVDRNVVLLGRKHWVCVFNIQTRSINELCLNNRHGDDDGSIFLPFVLKPMPTILPPPSWIASSK